MPNKYREYQRQYYKDNREKIRARAKELYPRRRNREDARRYGVSEEFIAELRENQTHCAICGKYCKVLYVDHNHDTGAVRELLCVSCNSALGLVKENIATLKSMIAYLKKHNSGDTST